jgi:pantoate--beta-alanine ligase
MQIFTSIHEMRAACKQARRQARQNATLGLVPTMGAIHQGHVSLVTAARKECDIVAASIFVNPIQFGPSEDFHRYPRTFEEDCRQLRASGVDLLFAPDVREMYPPEASTFVTVEQIGDRLDGASRPGHFRGVATVVAKLFHIVGADIAYFGQKDAAQIAVLQAMVRDLNFPVRLSICPIVREHDGLALSSRNRYLSPGQREHALALSRALAAAGLKIQQGERSAVALRETMLEVLDHAPGVRLDYVSVVNPDTLEDTGSVADGALLAIAAWVGETRLIDNLRFDKTAINSADSAERNAGTFQIEASIHA